MKVELRKDSGDLVLHASNGDPILKLQEEGPMVVVSSGRHVLDCRAEVLTPAAVEAVRGWCGSRSSGVLNDLRTDLEQIADTSSLPESQEANPWVEGRVEIARRALGRIAELDSHLITTAKETDRG